MGFQFSLKKSQSGSALVFAMGLCTLVVILATSMILSLSHDMRRYDHLQEAIIAKAAAQSGVAWALSMLEQKEITQKTHEIYETTLNNATVHISIIDVDGLFNVNVLLNEDSEEKESASSIFKRLTASLGIEESVFQAIHQSLSLVMISDMQPILAFSKQSYDKLLPYVQANRNDAYAMNVNTMPPQLMAAFLNISQDEASVLSSRGPFESEENFISALQHLSIKVPEEGFDKWLKYDSKQYLVKTEIQAKGKIQMYTLLVKTEEGWRVIYQSAGVRI